MKFFKPFACLLVVVLITSLAHAQDDEPRLPTRSKVLDDSTKQIYGPNTSKYYYEHAIFFGTYKSEPIDTLIRDFHLYNFVQRLNYEYQDLGNVATSMSPIFYKLPTQIGVRSGWSAFDPYWDLKPVRYFDTHSPYSNMNLVLGGKGRSMTDVVYSRNIKPNWNFGFNYRGLFVDKQIDRRGKGDRNVKSNYYDGFMTYHAKDSSYWAFFHFKRLRHVGIELGGVKVTDDFTFVDYFDPLATVNLLKTENGSENRDLRTTIHFFHQYRIVKGIEVYHQFDKYRQYVEFVDKKPDNTFFDYKAIDTITPTFDTELFKTLRNEIGVKGKLGSVFYNGYWAARTFSMDYEHLDEGNFQLRTKGTEYYVGGRLITDILKKIKLTAETEYLLNTNYRAKVSLASPWLEGSAASYIYKPTFVQQLYLGGHDAWVNHFDNIKANQLQALAHYRNKWLTLSGGGSFTILTDYVFFKENPELTTQKVRPQQSGGNQVIQSPEARFRLTALKHVSLSGRAVYSKLLKNADDAIQLPELFVHGQLAYENILIGGNLDFQAGLEAHWQSAYTANGYDVPTQQFFTQQAFTNNSYLVLDAFFNWKMKRGRMFFKYNNLMQAFTKTGYFSTPNYPAQRNIFDFGFDWSFYD